MDQHPLQQGQRERRRLAGAGLGRAHDVVPLQHWRDCLRLDRRHGLVAQIGHGLRQRCSELKLRERIDAGNAYWVCHLYLKGTCPRA